MATNQGAQISALQSALGAGYEAYPLEGLWHAYFTSAGIAAGTFNERMLLWLNFYLGASYADLPRAQQAYADTLGFYNWSSITTWDLSLIEEGDAYLLETGDFLLLETGDKYLLEA